MNSSASATAASAPESAMMDDATATPTAAAPDADVSAPASVAAAASTAASSSASAVHALDAQSREAPQPAAKKAKTSTAQSNGTSASASSSSVVNQSASTSAASASTSSSASSTSSPLFVVIIGGGLAGLSVALSLQAVGIACRVYERDPSLTHRKQGFGLTLTNSPVGALAQLGVLDQCLKQDCASSSHYVFDSRGNILGYYGRAFLSPEQLEKERSRNMRAAPASACANAALVAPKPIHSLSIDDGEGKSNVDDDAMPPPTASPLFYRSPTSVDPTNLLPLPSPSEAELSASPPAAAFACAAAAWPSSVMLQPFNGAGSSSSAAPTSAASAVSASASAPAAAASPFPPAKCWSSANLRIPRQDLRKLLYDRLLPDTVVWGARVKDYSEDPARGVRVEFHDGSSVEASMLVGADGINSIIRRLQDEKAKEKIAHLQYLQVAAIVGLSTAQHPLLHERGFYTMGQRHRLFTMPFRPTVFAEDGTTVLRPSLSMWQLSFALEDEAAARALNSTPPAELLAQALSRTEGWMVPVADLLSSTPLENIWATGLYDRAARRLRTKQQSSRVTVVGDACHPMSMFKGQGANQALQDGPLLAKMLTMVDRNTPAAALDANGRPILSSAALLNRIRRFEAQMVQRADSRVRASRAAAAALHSEQVSAPSDFFGIGGVPLSSEQILRVLARARVEHVGAQCNSALDERFGALLDSTVPPHERDANSKAPSGEEME